MSKNNNNSNLVLEEYESEFSYQKPKSNLIISFNRVAFIFFVFFIISIIFSSKAIYLGSFNKIERKLEILKSNFRSTILDNSGNIIAKTVITNHVGIDPKLVINKQKLLINLKLIFPDKNFSEIEKKLNGKFFFYIHKKISQEKLEELLLLGDKSIIPEEKIARIYPQENLFSHIVGQIDDDNKGISGIEKSYDFELRKDNKPLHLTLDTNIQFLIREELIKFQKIFRNKGSASILMDVNNGNILSMVSLPDFNLNKREEIKDVNFINRATKAVYEFGSVFKTFTVAAGLHERLIETDTEFLNLEKSLNELVIGQPEAIKKVSSSILRSKSGVRDRNKPIASFLLLGTTGVGKTFTAKMLAKAVFGGEDKIIRVDMSEFSEKASISRLIGASPGYVGFEDGGYLTESIRKKPYSVVLFDEVEKAHPDVCQVLLQIMDEGELKDSNGKIANFKNSIILLTGNVGHRTFDSKKTMGFAGGEHEPSFIESRKNVLTEAKKIFKPEFVNRLDEIIIFRPLSKQNNMQIARLELKNLADRLKAQNIFIKCTQKVLEFLVNKGTNAKNGARFLKRTIQKNIEDEISLMIISQKVKSGETIKISKKVDKLVLTV